MGWASWCENAPRNSIDSPFFAVVWGSRSWVEPFLKIGCDQFQSSTGLWCKNTCERWCVPWGLSKEAYSPSRSQSFLIARLAARNWPGVAKPNWGPSPFAHGHRHQMKFQELFAGLVAKTCCQNLLSWIAPGIWVAHGLTNLDTFGVFPAQNHSNNSEPYYHLGAAGIPKHLTPNLRSSAETGAHSWNCKICLAKLCSAAGSLRCSGRTPGGTHKATKWAHQII